MLKRSQRISAWLKALWNFVDEGANFATKEQIESRFVICETCEHFDGRGCEKCGCCTNRKTTLFNKLAMPTEECPEGKWHQINRDTVSQTEQE